MEDLTGMGISDLEAGVIRTPIDPLLTFKDDPVRLLRAVRFAGRYRFQMVSEVIEAAHDAEIRNALLFKVTRERIGREFDKMLSGSNAHVTITHLHDLGLLKYLY